MASKLASKLHVLEQRREFRYALRREKRKSTTVIKQRATLRKSKKEVTNVENVKIDGQWWTKQVACWQEKSVTVEEGVTEKADDLKM